MSSKRFLIIAAIAAFLLLLITVMVSSRTSQDKKSVVTTDIKIEDVTITSFSPADNSAEVGIFQEVRVDFDRAISKNDQDLTYVSLSPEVDGDQVWSSDGKALIFKPSSPLLSEKTYTATVFVGDTEHSWTFTTTATDNVTQEDEIKAQKAADDNYLKDEARIENSYPWLEKLPIEAANYYVYFDIEKESFIGQLYPQRPSQTEPMKAEILTKLKERGIPTEGYGVEWEATVE